MQMPLEQIRAWFYLRDKVERHKLHRAWGIAKSNIIGEQDGEHKVVWVKLHGLMGAHWARIGSYRVPMGVRGPMGAMRS